MPETATHDTPETDADRDDDAADETEVVDAADAEAVLHDLLAYLDERTRTAAATDPPGARVLSERTGRIAVPSHRRGYQQGVYLAAEGALDRVVEDVGYCDWDDVQRLHAARYSDEQGAVADDPADGSAGDDTDHDDPDADTPADPDPDPELRTDGGVAETNAHPRSREAWTRTTGQTVAAEYVADRHEYTAMGVPHSELVTHLLLGYDRDPEQAHLAIHWAVEDGLIHDPDLTDHYRPTPSFESDEQADADAGGSP